MCNTAHPPLLSRVSRAGAAPAAIPLRPDAAPAPEYPCLEPARAPRETPRGKGKKGLKCRGRGGRVWLRSGIGIHTHAHTPRGEHSPRRPPGGRHSARPGRGCPAAAESAGGGAQAAPPAPPGPPRPPCRPPAAGTAARTWSDMAQPRVVRQARLGRCRRSAPFSARSANTGPRHGRDFLCA